MPVMRFAARGDETMGGREGEISYPASSGLEIPLRPDPMSDLAFPQATDDGEGDLVRGRSGTRFGRRLVQLSGRDDAGPSG